MKFNKSQLRAVNHIDGPALVIAGPGSGKTTVVTHRIKRLTERGADPGSILVATFSRAAAEEMKIRYEKLVSERCGARNTHVNGGVVFGTFHSFFFQILKREYHYKNTDILTDGEKSRYISGIARGLGVGAPNMSDFADGVISDISRMKNTLTPPDKYKPRVCGAEIFSSIYIKYKEIAAKSGKIDFDDMLVKCLELFNKNRDILEYWQNRYSYILVDEFQDINIVQYEIIKMLALPQNNIFAVGDDDQSIYGFRGADPEIMFKFERDYKSSERILLDINYRSSAAIINGAKRLISHNKTRFEKNIRPAGGRLFKNKTAADARIFKDYQMQARAIADRIKKYMSDGVRPDEIAVLARTNSQQKIIAEILGENDIPFNRPHGRSVSALTMHGSKGLEYKVVFIASANKGIVPGNKIVSLKEMEEERRVFYVAVTRAAEKLHIYAAEGEYGKKMAVSGFVDELMGL